MPQISEQSEYTFKYFYLTLFQIFLRARAREKNSRWHTFSGFNPTSFSYNTRAASPHCKFGSNPCNYVCKTINGIIGKIPLQKFGKETTLKFDKTITKFQHLFHSILFIFIKMKKTMRYLPLLLVVFQIPPFLSLGYPCIFGILPPFFIFTVTDRKHMEFWCKKVTSPHFKIQNGH